MKKYLLFILIFRYCAIGFSQEPHWQQEADYAIQVTLNDHDHTLDGFIRIRYQNRSPDTLLYLWFHLWANAFKSDKTAYCEQLLGKGQLDFYFSSPEQKGYINQLDFRVNDIHAELEDHPAYIDVARLILPAALLPDSQIIITTPFHVKLPHNFSDGGHKGETYQVLQWFPKLAVYDQKGWHPMPYLQQSETYCATGNFEAAITLPRNYVVAASGILQEENEKEWMKSRSSFSWKERRYRKKIKAGTYKTIHELYPPSDSATKTIHYTQDQAQNFVWFADKRFAVHFDTCHLTENKVIDIYSFHQPAAAEKWHNSIVYTKKILQNYNRTPSFPFTSFSLVEAARGTSAKNVSPDLALLVTPRKGGLTQSDLLYAIKGFRQDNKPHLNTGEHSRMDENGITFGENQSLENSNTCFQWQTYSEKDSLLKLLKTQINIPPPVHKKIRLAWIGQTNPKNKYHYINLTPALGYNYYDKLMAGILIHNYSQPFNRLKFITVPLFATSSKQVNGIGRLTYTWHPKGLFYGVEAGLSMARFSGNTYTDENNKTTHLQYNKLTPQIRLTFRNSNPNSKLNRFVQWKTHIINRDNLIFSWDSVLMKNNYFVNSKSRTINQLRLVTDNSRALYPYRYELQLELSKDFGKITGTGNYFFNYPSGGGLNVRGFAGKFFYPGGKTNLKKGNAGIYQLNLSTSKGEEDYTYGNYFIGRNEFNGLLTQQVMMRDGGFKVRTDLLSSKIGKTDDWLVALNFTSSVYPVLPLKLFLDLGSYSNVRDNRQVGSRILFDAGLQLSFCKDIINIYVPLLYSTVYRDYYLTIPGNNFGQRISFSIDIQDIHLNKITRRVPL